MILLPTYCTRHAGVGQSCHYCCHASRLGISHKQGVQLPWSLLLIVLGFFACKLVLYQMQEELHIPAMPPFTQQLTLGGPAAQSAEETWHAATSHTNSFLRPLFCGRYQSCVQCTCGYRSNSFDPVEDVSLQLPQKTTTVPDVLSPFTVQVCGAQLTY